jgi:hypothetical protein
MLCQVDSLFKQADADGSGEIDFEEFLDAQKKKTKLRSMLRTSDGVLIDKAMRLDTRRRACLVQPNFAKALNESAAPAGTAAAAEAPAATHEAAEQGAAEAQQGGGGEGAGGDGDGQAEGELPPTMRKDLQRVAASVQKEGSGAPLPPFLARQLLIRDGPALAVRSQSFVHRRRAAPPAESRSSGHDEAAAR